MGLAPFIFPGLGLASTLFPGDASQMDSTRQTGIQLTVNAGSYALEKTYPLGQTFEIFRTGWESRRIPAELGKVWEQSPPALRAEFRFAFTPHARFYLDLGLKRELSAWHADPMGGNWPLSADEVALNQPSAGYFQSENSWASLTIGRFATHWSPSPEYGLALSRELPHHNGVLLTMGSKRVHFHFLASSLNPWLQGSPTGDTSGVGYPIGSEEWRQRNYPGSLNDNAHLRVYDERIKTLIAHRLTWTGPSLELGITELSIIGGKTPDLRDLNPFALIHNDFKDGFASMAVSLDIKARLPMGFTAWGELFADDLRWNETEASSARSILGWMLGGEHVFQLPPFRVRQTFHTMYTDPVLYRFLQPYNTLHSRLIYTSNNQGANDSPFVDKYVVDYPLGYARGGGVMDWRYAARLESGKTRTELRLDYLTFSGAALSVPFDSLVNGSADLSPYRSEEWRAVLSGERDLTRSLTLGAGIGAQVVSHPARAGKASVHFQVACGLTWRWFR